MFDAIRIDRTIVTCSIAKQRINFAEMVGDKEFFRHLNSAIKGPNRKHWANLEITKYMMQALVGPCK